MACRLSFARESNSGEGKRWGQSGEQAWRHGLTELWWRCGLTDHPDALPFPTGTSAKPKPFPTGSSWVWPWVSPSSTDKFGWHLTSYVKQTFFLGLSLSILRCRSVPLIQYHVGTKSLDSPFSLAFLPPGTAPSTRLYWGPVLCHSA